MGLIGDAVGTKDIKTWTTDMSVHVVHLPGRSDCDCKTAGLSYPIQWGIQRSLAWGVSPVAGQRVSYVCTSREGAEHAGIYTEGMTTSSSHVTIVADDIERFEWLITAGAMHVSHA